MSRSPNVLFLFADQHNARFAGFENHPDVLTPHLDRLAEEGTRFTRAYCQDGICVPSRCSLFSGLSPRTLGCMRNDDRTDVMREVFPLTAAFGANGYTTAAFGKRHLERACDDGWDVAASHFVHESPDDNYVRWVHEQGLGDAFDRDWAAEFRHGAHGTPAEKRVLPFSPLATHESHLPPGATMEAWTCRRTIAFLERQKRRAEPFFCFASFYRPHQPYTPVAKYYRRFDRTRWGAGRRAGDGLSLPASLRQNPGELPPRFQRVFQGVNPVFCLDRARHDEQLYRNYIAAYIALVEEIDDHVGEILGALGALGLSDDTIVVYASDHGDFVGAHGMIEKCAAGHNVYEDTLRVPLIFRGPGIRAGRWCDGLVELLDLYPTLAALCGLTLPSLRRPLEGCSLTDVLWRGKPVGRRFTVSENWVQSTVITADHKLGVWQDPRHPEACDYRAFGDMLFSRATDPGEVVNLAGWPEHAGTEAALRSMLREWDRSFPRGG